MAYDPKNGGGSDVSLIDRERPPSLMLDRTTRSSEVHNVNAYDDDDGYDSDGALSYDGNHYTPPTSPRLVLGGKKWKVPNLMPHGGILASAVNMAQASLGAGTLGFASALQHTGIGLGLILTFLFLVTTIYSVKFLCMGILKTGYNTYEGLVAKVIHPKAKQVLAGIIIVYYWGTTTLYTIAIGQILHPLTDSPSFPVWTKGVWGGRAVTAIFWFVFMNPLSLLKEMNSLRFSSFFGLITIIMLAFAIVWHAQSEGEADFSKATYFKFDVGVLVALPTIIFSFSCQALTFGIFHELHPKTTKRMTQATSGGMIAACCIYLACGIWGYLNFGEKIKGDILQNYKDPSSSPIMLCAFIGMGITLTFSFPVCIVPTRDSILQLMGYKDVYHTPTLVRCAVAGGLSLLSLLGGLFISNISILFNVLGGVCGGICCFILPALIALCSRKTWFRLEKVGYFDTFMAWLMLVLGVITCILGTAVGLMEDFGK